MGLSREGQRRVRKGREGEYPRPGVLRMEGFLSRHKEMGVEGKGKEVGREGFKKLPFRRKKGAPAQFPTGGRRQAGRAVLRLMMRAMFVTHMNDGS